MRSIVRRGAARRLADFDVIMAQLALADGEPTMTELAARTFN
jgi:hypothetical protein